ncbi:prephenate dehydratase [Anaerorhabdus furcosa]|uniref:Prephenate dehydratase n=1 Tax=Anaerorhabdus furcosa TaxID=118967 RepID=A0A1T4PXQ3_9FIRM|nr:prephenate dehydratase domain-containing protein [Anaerorhabdus furcosa]SJZ95748.1 chorismate mutase [Anaerorhabdus furcosa]
MEKLKVGYQGEHGTFSEIAVCQYYKNIEIEQRSYKNFIDILNDLESGVLDTALLPVENSTTGIIYRTYDLLASRDVFAIGEQNVRIQENLIGIQGSKIEEIKEVYSHPEALGQCTGFFNTHPWMKPVSYQDTAKSVEFIKECNDPTKGALASYLAAEYYDCPILEKNVNDNALNTTRFLCVCKGERIVENANKISMYFVVNHEPGALYEVIKIFAENHLNMLKLESRPIQGRLFEYCFYIDFDGSLDNPVVQEVIAKVKGHCVEMKCLGSYRKSMED